MLFLMPNQQCQSTEGNWSSSLLERDVVFVYMYTIHINAELRVHFTDAY